MYVDLWCWCSGGGPRGPEQRDPRRLRIVSPDESSKMIGFPGVATTSARFLRLAELVGRSSQSLGEGRPRVTTVAAARCRGCRADRPWTGRGATAAWIVRGRAATAPRLPRESSVDGSRPAVRRHENSAETEIATPPRYCVVNKEGARPAATNRSKSDSPRPPRSASRLRTVGGSCAGSPTNTNCVQPGAHANGTSAAGSVACAASSTRTCERKS